jgi:hypothetical protein
MVDCKTINKYSKFDEIEVGNKEFETYNFTEAEKTNLKNDLSLNVCEKTDIEAIIDKKKANNNRSYKKYASKLHPDKNKDKNKDENCEKAFQIFKNIKDKIDNNCYEIRKLDKNEMKPKASDQKTQPKAKDSEQKTQPKEDKKKQPEEAADQKTQQEKKAAEDNLNNIRNNLIQFTKTVLIDANATATLLDDVVYNLEIVLEYDEEKKDTTKAAIKAVKKAVDSAEKAVESSKKAFQSTGETFGFINNANETAQKMQLKKNNTKQLHDNQIMVDQINKQMIDLQKKTEEVFNTVQNVKDAIDKLQPSKEKPNEKTGGAPLNDITTAVKTAIENAQQAIEFAESAIDSTNTLRKTISTNSELVLDSIQNSFLSEVFKFFTDNTANKVDNDEGKKFIESTELNTTYMYGELPSKKDMLKCETLEKEEEKEKCIYDLQKKQNLLEEYTIQEKHEDSFMVPWSMENFLYMLSDTKSNISRYKQVYYKTDDTANPVYTHKVSKTVKKRIPVMEYDSDPDNPKNVVE